MDLSNSSPGSIASTSSTPLSGVNIYPLKLCFPFETEKRIDCPLSITNITDRYVNYWVVPQFPNMYTPCKHELVNEIRTGTNNLDPMSTGSFNVTMLEQQQPPLDAGMFEIVMIAMGSRSDLKKLKSSIGDEPKIDGELLKRVEEVGGEVHTAMLRAVISLPSEGGVAPKVSSAYQILRSCRVT
uniref:MSP domain-containing protein n=1 Tax=Aegilops tauschii subsp. strangulata TaxID=200361 RepID=A0A453JR64_AEGTS